MSNSEKVCSSTVLPSVQCKRHPVDIDPRSMIEHAHKNITARLAGKRASIMALHLGWEHQVCLLRKYTLEGFHEATSCISAFPILFCFVLSKGVFGGGM